MWVTSVFSQNNGGCVAMWMKSTASFANGDCVEWASPAASAVNNCVERTVRSSHSAANGACAELCPCGTEGCGLVHVRDSKDPDGLILDYPEATWNRGEAVIFMPVSKLLVPARIRDIAAGRGHDPGAHWYQVCPSLRIAESLWFDQAEADAWYKGVAAGEFDLYAGA